MSNNQPTLTYMLDRIQPLPPGLVDASFLHLGMTITNITLNLAVGSLLDLRRFVDHDGRSKTRDGSAFNAARNAHALVFRARAGADRREPADGGHAGALGRLRLVVDVQTLREVPAAVSRVLDDAVGVSRAAHPRIQCAV